MTNLRHLLLALFFFVLATSINLSADDISVNEQFEPAEHLIAGDGVLLFFAQGDAGEKGQALHLPNGLVLSFGDMISMGDFYSVLGKPISKGQDDADREARFRAVFSTLANNTDAVSEANQIVASIHQVRVEVLDAVKHGKKAEDVFQGQAETLVKKWNCITGGACSGPVWWLNPGRFLLLANENYDHFGANAVTAYLAGHRVAMQEAALAGKTHDKAHLEIAYAMDALSNHYLTDRFASGHMRTPRVELPAHVTPGFVGSLLAGFMHNEECKSGLHVHNERGEHWVAFGDAYYLNPLNKRNLEIMEEVLQLSANEVFAAYSSAEISDSKAILALIPQTDEDHTNVHLDVAPLFYWDAGSSKIMRRKEMSDLHDQHWTSHWIGWTSLIELRKIEGLPTDGHTAPNMLCVH